MKTNEIKLQQLISSLIGSTLSSKRDSIRMKKTNQKQWEEQKIDTQMKKVKHLRELTEKEKKKQSKRAHIFLRLN